MFLCNLTVFRVDPRDHSPIIQCVHTQRVSVGWSQEQITQYKTDCKINGSKFRNKIRPSPRPGPTLATYHHMVFRTQRTAQFWMSGSSRCCTIPGSSAQISSEVFRNIQEPSVWIQSYSGSARRQTTELFQSQRSFIVSLHTRQKMSTHLNRTSGNQGSWAKTHCQLVVLSKSWTTTINTRVWISLF